MKTLLLSLMLTSRMSVSARAIETGDELLNACQEFEKTVRTTSTDLIQMEGAQAYICWGFMNAMQGVSRIVDGGKPILGSCAPPNSSLTQPIRVFTNYALSRPQDLHLPAAVLVSIVFPKCVSVSKLA
jgi:hypothetical protein